MSLLPEDLARQSAVAAVYGAFAKSNTVDQLLPRMLALGAPINGDSLQVSDILALTEPHYVSSGDPIDDLATMYEDDPRRYDLRNIRAQVEVSGKIAQADSDSRGIDIYQQQIDAKMLGMWNTAGLQAI